MYGLAEVGISEHEAERWVNEDSEKRKTFDHNINKAQMKTDSLPFHWASSHKLIGRPQRLSILPHAKHINQPVIMCLGPT